MKRLLILPVTIILTILLSAITVVFAIDVKEEPLYEKKADITGDGKADLLIVNGTSLEKSSAILKDMKLKVTTSEGKSVKLQLENGYDPSVQLHDFNHDGVDDLFLTVQTGESIGQKNYLYSLKDGKKQDLTVPESLSVSSQYMDDYKATIKIDRTGEAYTFNLKDKKKNYETLGLYHDGKLNEPMELIVSPFTALKPVKLANSKLGLKGIQRFSGVSDKKTIGFVESTWQYENGTWKLLDTSVRKNMKTKKKK